MTKNRSSKKLDTTKMWCGRKVQHMHEAVREEKQMSFIEILQSIENWLNHKKCTFSDCCCGSMVPWKLLEYEKKKIEYKNLDFVEQFELGF